MSGTEDVKVSDYMLELYDVTKLSDEELKLWSDAYSYKGFDRFRVIKELSQKVQEPKVAQQIIMICGLLGPQRASQTKLINGRLVGSYGIPASGAKGSDGISCQRITSATADLCAYLLKKVNTPKRLNIACPAWLQFPSAGSIMLPDDLRQQHIEFSKRFSTVIGGEFNEQIYQQMVMNSYLDQGLHLFDAPRQQSLVTSASNLSSPMMPQTEASSKGKSVERKKPP